MTGQKYPADIIETVAQAITDGIAAGDSYEAHACRVLDALGAVYEAAVSDALHDGSCVYERRMAELLCELTDGRMSGTGYDVRTMVREVEAAFERGTEEAVAGAVAAERERCAQIVLNLNASYREQGLTLQRGFAVAEWMAAEAEAEADHHIADAIWADREPEPAAEAQPCAQDDDGRIRIWVNSNVKMSRGKYAAAAVHAALEAFGVHPGVPVIVLGGQRDHIERMRTVIRDAGRTEVEPGTPTAGTDYQAAPATEEGLAP